MLTKIQDKEIISVWDAVNKYQEKYFIMIITETIDNVYHDRGYVIYASENRKDLIDIPLDEYTEGKATFWKGLPKVLSPMDEMSRVVYYD